MDVADLFVAVTISNQPVLLVQKVTAAKKMRFAGINSEDNASEILKKLFSNEKLII
jgi:hypothetical protein